MIELAEATATFGLDGIPRGDPVAGQEVQHTEFSLSQPLIEVNPQIEPGRFEGNPGRLGRPQIGGCEYDLGLTLLRAEPTAERLGLPNTQI